ncbi:MAG: ankyrin repeat domain-containing protein [Desulfomonilaceae bacterium]
MSLVECPECNKQVSKNVKACPNCGVIIDCQVVQAAGSGDLEKVIRLLDNGSAIDAVDWHGETALIEASVNGHIGIVKYLLERGADPYHRDNDGESALSKSSWHEDDQAVRFLLESVDGWQYEDLRPVLGRAIMKDWRDLVSVLVKEVGADGPVFNAFDTPLTLAATFNRPSVVSILLENGADIDKKGQFQTGEDKSTALCIATGAGHKEIVRLLLEHGANPNSDTDFWTPLGLATTNGYIDIVRLLLEHGAQVDLRFGENVEDQGIKHGPWTALLECRFAFPELIADLLLKHGADVNARDGQGATLLILTTHSGRDYPLNWIRFLLNNGATVNAQRKDGRTALMGACSWKRTDVVELLLERGANPNVKDCHSWRAIDCAYRNSEIVGLLKRYGAKRWWWPF